MDIQVYFADIKTDELVKRLECYKFVDSFGHDLKYCVEFMELVRRAKDAVL